MDLKKLVTFKNVFVGVVVTLAAVITSVQTIRNTVGNLFLSGSDPGAIHYEVARADSVTGEVELAVYWLGAKENDAPKVKSATIEQGAFRSSDHSARLLNPGYRLGTEKSSVVLQREKSGRFWQEIKAVIRAGRLSKDVDVAQQEIYNGRIEWTAVPARGSARDVIVTVKWDAPPQYAGPSPRVVSASLSGAARKRDGRPQLFSQNDSIPKTPVTVPLQRFAQGGSRWQAIRGVIQTDLCPPETLYVGERGVAVSETPGKVTPPPPDHKDQNPIGTAIEDAARRELERILKMDNGPLRFKALEDFVNNPKFAGTAAVQQARQVLGGFRK